MKRITACILSVLLLFALFPGLRVFAADHSGSHGDTLYWEYDSTTQTLTLSGTGEMPYDAPSYESEEDKYGWYSLRDSIRHLVIEEGITRISNCAFMEYPSLQTVSFPASLRSIGDSAFKGCTMLMDISFRSAPEELGYYVFKGCTSLTSVSLPEGLTELPRWTFSDCTNLADVHLPDTLKVIGIGAFEYCYNLKEILLPAGLTCIEKDAFWACNELASVSFPGTLERIGENAFAYCHSLKELQLPEDLESIGEGAFYRCSSLTAVTFPGGLTELPGQTFYGCTGLVSVDLPEGLEYIGESAFRNCTALETVVFPETLKTIEKYAFQNCTALAPVKLSAGTQVNLYAFEGCHGQWRLFSNIFLADSALYLTLAAVALIGLIWLVRMRQRTGPRIFWSRVGGVILLTAAVIAAAIGLTLYRQYMGNDIDIHSERNYDYDATTKTLTITGYGKAAEPKTYKYDEVLDIEHIVIGEGFTVIGSYAFYGFSELKTVSLPNSLRRVEDDAFQFFADLTDIDVSWHTYVHPDALGNHPWPLSLWFHMFLQYLPLILLVFAPILVLIVPPIQSWLDRRKRSQS